MALLIRSFTPPSVGIGFKFCPHETNEIVLCEPKLLFDGIKGGAVFPAHAHQAVFVVLNERVDFCLK